MTAVPTVAGLTDDEQRTLARLVADLEARVPRNVLRASYYDGKHAVKQVGSIIAPQYYRLGVTLGWSAKAVDILARRCNLDGFTWADGDIESLGLSELVDANYLYAELSQAFTSSLIHGPAFLVNCAGEPGEPESIVQVRTALDGTGTWNRRTRRLDDFLSVHERNDYGELTAFTLYVPGVTVTARRDSSGWSVDRSATSGPIPVEVLPYRPRPGRPFGQSRISRPVMSLHDQALRTVIRMEGHADVFSSPQMLLLGADESAFKNPDGSVKPSWQVALGRVFALDDDDERENPRASVSMFQASSPAPHIEQLKQQAMLFSGETSIPLTSLGVSDMSNPTSADSYIASREDLIAEAEGATDDWSPGLRRIIIRALATQNGLEVPPDSWRSIMPKWRSPLHLSRAAEADAGAKQLGAVPWLAETTVGLELLGLSDEQIKRAQAERRRAQGLAVLSNLGVIGDEPSRGTTGTEKPSEDAG